MALFSRNRQQVFVSISCVLCVIIFHIGLVTSAPSSSGLQDLKDVPVSAEILTDLTKDSEKAELHVKEKEEGGKEDVETSRTLESMMSMMSSFNIFSNMANLFGQQGTRYEWVPLGSLIFSNRLGQGANSNKKAAT